jgi:hypothetical protein
MSEAPSTFADLGLDPRLLRALEKRQYEKPTPVQVGSSFLHWDTAAASIAQHCLSSSKSSSLSRPWGGLWALEDAYDEASNRCLRRRPASRRC